MEHRRETTRISLRFHIEYEGFERFRPDRVLNLSCGGIFVLTPKPLKMGDHVRVRFELPELQQSFSILSRVVWIPGKGAEGAGKRHPRGMGLAFEDLEHETKQVLDQFVVIAKAQETLDARIGNEPARSLPRFRPSDNAEESLRELPSTSEIERFFEDLDLSHPPRVYEEQDRTPVTPLNKLS